MEIEVLTPEELKQLEKLERVHEASMNEWELKLIKEGKSPEEAKSIINKYR